MIKHLACLLWLLAACGPALAQSAPAPAAVPALAPPAAKPAAPAARPATQAVSPAQARLALEVLKDDQKRAAFIATLEAITAGLPAGAPAASPAGAPPGAPPGAPVAPPAEPDALALPLAPDSLGAQVLEALSGWTDRLRAEATLAARTLTSLPAFYGWVVTMATDPLARGLLADTAWRLAVVLGAAAAGDMLTRRALRRPMAALQARASPLRIGLGQDGTNAPIASAEAGETEARRRRYVWLLGGARRVPLALANFALNAVPVLVFALVGHALIGTDVGGARLIRLVLLALTDGVAGVGMIVAVAQAVLAPGVPGLRLLPVGDEAAAGGVRWTLLIAMVGVFGYAAAEAGLLLGLSRTAHGGMLKLVGLVIMVFVLVIIRRNRDAVAGAIRAAPEASGAFALLRNRGAAVWHLVAGFYIAGIWLVWAVDVPDGPARLLRFSLITAAVLTASRMLTLALLDALDRWVPATATHPLQLRARHYRPLLRAVVFVAVLTAALLVLLEIWGIGALGWFTGGGLGGRMLSASASVIVTGVIALAVWELANAAIERHLARLTREAQLARSARLRTLLPMLRTALLVTIVVIVGLTVLSEIGVNITPLLAGASVVGLAIGFGSQKLVQDIITGLFLLLENTMQVGDVVSLAGMSGVVEQLSVRTIRLRAMDGSIHIIPFSAVTTVTNMTRDFGYAVIDATVAYSEDPDRVGEVMRSVFTAMRAEPRWNALIRDDLDLQGLEKLGDGSMLVRARIKTPPAQHWTVGREYNRRLKLALQEAGIQRPAYMPTIVMQNPGGPDHADRA